MSADAQIVVRTVGIVGLGDQGTPIALRVLEKGWPLSFYARREEVRREFSARGARSMSLKEMAAASDLVLVVVVDEPQIRQVLIADGTLDAMRSDTIVAVHSTVAPEIFNGPIADAARARGVHLLDAPVSGGRARSYAGDLTLLVGGDNLVLDAARPVLEAYGSLIVHMGALGAGQVAKLLNNYFYAVHAATAAKQIELVHALGLNLDAAAAALPHCSGSTAAFAIQATRRFAPTQHNKGSTYAMGVLREAVEGLRHLASNTGVDLSAIDPLADATLEERFA